MYLFEKCPFEVDPSADDRICFDPAYLDCFKRPPDIVHHYCQGDFRGCPYYLTKGVPSRIPEEAKPKVLHNTSASCGKQDTGAMRGNAKSQEEKKA